MDKKAQYEFGKKFIYWMIAGVVVSAVIVFTAFVISGYSDRLTSVPPELEADLISLRFTNIPECFAYQDSSGRVYTSSIDLTKFNQERLNGCYSTDEELGRRDFNFELDLDGKKLETNKFFDITHFTLRRKVMVKDADKPFEMKELIIHVQAGLSGKGQ